MPGLGLIAVIAGRIATLDAAVRVPVPGMRPQRTRVGAQSPRMGAVGSGVGSVPTGPALRGMGYYFPFFYFLFSTYGYRIPGNPVCRIPGNRLCRIPGKLAGLPPTLHQPVPLAALVPLLTPDPFADKGSNDLPRLSVALASGPIPDLDG